MLLLRTASHTHATHARTHGKRRVAKPQSAKQSLTFSDDWFERTLDLSLDFSLTLSDARRQAVSTMSLTSSCISRVIMVCCIWRRCANH